MSDDNNNKPLDALLLEKSAEIVMAFVANNAVRASDLHDLLSAVHATLKACAFGEVVVTSEAPAVLVPAVPVRKSVSADFLVCLEDGLKFKSLKRHLMSKYQLSPEAYRAKWNLPGDYPMTAPNYAKVRSDVAKARGLGRKIETVADAADDLTSSYTISINRKGKVDVEDEQGNHVAYPPASPKAAGGGRMNDIIDDDIPF